MSINWPVIPCRVARNDFQTGEFKRRLLWTELSA